jgi:hypothetical protein
MGLEDMWITLFHSKERTFVDYMFLGIYRYLQLERIVERVINYTRNIMSGNKKEEINLSKCNSCQEIKVRKQDGFYPDMRNKRWVDENGKAYIGRCCPSCVLKNMKTRMKKLRDDRKVESDV